ncbi:toprim domain-containing protein, partial [uncultured Campylobacter sp.]|uniref:toprim domain-containing protein n=1 Tax=uncultured Campylobacter sp. TaxID=218934 RepID=UPI0026212489
LVLEPVAPKEVVDDAVPTAKRAAAEKRMRARIASIAPELVSNFEAMRPTLIENGLRGIFVNYEAPTFLTYSKDAIGYSHEHQSIAIIIRDERGVPLNIKYREKFAWDSKARAISSERMSGKWIGESGAAAAPFPIRYFLDNPDDRVIVCEGEKDALNLMSFNVNALTLGGAGSRWDEYLELLRGKDVYIWFDHDEAGYENAIKRYYEIKPVARSTHIVLFYMLEKDLNKKYDISDWLYNHTSKITNDNMFDLLAFSCFEPTNIVIDEICDYFPNLREKLAPFRRGKIIHYFDEIFAKTLQKNIQYIWTLYLLAKENKRIEGPELGRISELVIDYGLKNLKGADLESSENLIEETLPVLSALKWSKASSQVNKFF